MSEINNLIKTVGINLSIINIIWIGLLPFHLQTNTDIDVNLNFLGYKFHPNLKSMVYLFQLYMTLKLVDKIKNA